MKQSQQQIIAAIQKCIDECQPFFAYALPDQDVIQFGSDMRVSMFGTDADIVMLDSAPGASCRPYGESTAYNDYIEGLEHVIDRLKRDGGKTVISRTLTGCGCLNIDKLFNATDYHAFRFVYYTKATGLWAGASPELLLCRSRDGMFTTMALAGTVSGVGNDVEWDQKNIKEHDFVVDYIVKRFADCGLNAVVGDAQTVGHASVKHLRHMITASSKMQDEHLFECLLHSLNPTPALAGWPKDVAEREINMVERHPRLCYGGYIDFTNNDGVRYAYVNLRSAHFGDGRYCIYTGGGITEQSIPALEWDETLAKSRTALSMIDISDV